MAPSRLSVAAIATAAVATAIAIAPAIATAVATAAIATAVAIAPHVEQLGRPRQTSAYLSSQLTSADLG